MLVWCFCLGRGTNLEYFGFRLFSHDLRPLGYYATQLDRRYLAMVSLRAIMKETVQPEIKLELITRL